RSAAGPAEIAWDPARGALDPAGLEDLAALVHLGGAGIAEGRWTPARKRLLRESRLASTALLAETLARLARPPRAFLCASAVGIYGDAGETPVDEGSPPGRGFLAELARDWEAACAPARAAGIRVVNLRLGTVLAREGGALARLAPLARLGLGGPLGSGRQYLSWIALEDLVAALRFCLEREDIAGPVNLVAPDPRRQVDFARALGRTLGRPALVPAPGFALRLLLGEMAGELLLTGAAVRPARLEAAGFRWRWPRLEGALADLLGRP
ncbi:TIGR01777 family protein, partial [bacterium]|nr:TIGR01777 family protein [bacterium]